MNARIDQRDPIASVYNGTANEKNKGYENTPSKISNCKQ